MIRLLSLILLGCVLLNNAALASNRNVWIDADPACGMGKTKDVDDCWAIVAAIKSSRLNVVGLSTIFGNISLEKATAMSRTLMSTIGSFEPNRELPPVFSGAHVPIGESLVMPPAVKGLENSLVEHPMTILALGPLTNIALLLKKRPDLVNRIEGIVAVAGQKPGQVFNVGSTPIMHFHDMNVRKDVDAFDIVLRSGVPIHLIPFEVGMQVVVTRTDLGILTTKGKLDTWIGERSIEWLNFWESTLGASGFSPFDTIAVAYLVEPQLFTCDAIPAKIIRRRGFFVVRDTLEVARSISDGEEVTYCTQVSKEVRNFITDFVSNPDSISVFNSGQTTH